MSEAPNEPNNEILDFIFNFNKQPKGEESKIEPEAAPKKTAKHAVKAN